MGVFSGRDLKKSAGNGSKHIPANNMNPKPQKYEKMLTKGNPLVYWGLY